MKITTIITSLNNKISLWLFEKKKNYYKWLSQNYSSDFVKIFSYKIGIESSVLSFVRTIYDKLERWSQ